MDGRRGLFAEAAGLLLLLLQAQCEEFAVEAKTCGQVGTVTLPRARFQKDGINVRVAWSTSDGAGNDTLMDYSDSQGDKDWFAVVPANSEGIYTQQSGDFPQPFRLKGELDPIPASKDECSMMEYDLVLQQSSQWGDFFSLETATALQTRCQEVGHSGLFFVDIFQPDKQLFKGFEQKASFQSCTVWFSQLILLASSSGRPYNVSILYEPLDNLTAKASCQQFNCSEEDPFSYYYGSGDFPYFDYDGDPMVDTSSDRSDEVFRFLFVPFLFGTLILLIWHYTRMTRAFGRDPLREDEVVVDLRHRQPQAPPEPEVDAYQEYLKGKEESQDKASKRTMFLHRKSSIWRQGLPEHLCPITQEPMLDPVTAEDGNNYERAAITAWLKSKQRSPLTNEPMGENLVANDKLKKQIKDWAESQFKKRKEQQLAMQVSETDFSEEEPPRTDAERTDIEDNSTRVQQGSGSQGAQGRGGQKGGDSQSE